MASYGSVSRDKAAKARKKKAAARKKKASAKPKKKGVIKSPWPK